METTQKKEFSCKLTSHELQKRKEEVIAVLKAKMLDKVELPNGFKYKFPPTDELAAEITSFIKSEKACCGFFEFDYMITNSAIWLTIKGPEGIKDFIRTELTM